MKKILLLSWLMVQCFCSFSQTPTDTVTLKKSLDKATAAIRSAFEKGDAALVASLHHPDVIKYFGENNVTVGREAVERGLKEWFKNFKIEFAENTVESTVFSGDTAIETQIFAFKSTPKNGGDPSMGRGRSMVVYIQDSSSPTGWLTIREMAQEAPPKK